MYYEKGIEVENINSNLGYKPKAGYEYIYITVKITNEGKKTIPYAENQFKIQNGKGQINGVDSGPFSGRLHSGELAAGGYVEGRVGFQVPKGDQKLILLYNGGTKDKDQRQINIK